MISLLPEGARSTLPSRPCPTVSPSHAALAVSTFWDVYSPPSDFICYLSVEHGDEFAMNLTERHCSEAYSPKCVEGHSKKFAQPHLRRICWCSWCSGSCAPPFPPATDMVMRPGGERNTPKQAHSSECVENKNSRKFTVASNRSDAAVSTRQQPGGTPSASERSDLVAVVAPLCIKELRLVTAQLPEKSGLIGPGHKPTSPLRSSRKFA
jgi:hypothetical protein